MSRRSSEIHRLQSKILIRTNYFMQPCRKDTNYGMCFDMQAYKKYESLWNCKLSGLRLLFAADRVVRLSTLSTLVREMPPSDFIWLTEQARMFKEGISAPIWVRGGRLDAPPHSIFGRWSCQAPLS